MIPSRKNLSLPNVLLGHCLFLLFVVVTNILEFSMAFFYPKLRTLLYTIKIITLIGNNNAFSVCNFFCLTVTIALQKSDKAI